LGVALVILLNKLTSLLAPYGWYFSFEALIYVDLAEQAIIIKFAIPLIVGFIIGLFSQENTKGTGGVIGFLSSFILAWPAIISWELHAPFGLIDKQQIFQIYYLFYFVAYSYLSISGALLSAIYLIWHQNRKTKKQQKSVILDIFNWEKTVKPIFIGVTSSVLSTILAKIFAK